MMGYVNRHNAQMCCVDICEMKIYTMVYKNTLFLRKSNFLVHNGKK